MACNYHSMGLTLSAAAASLLLSFLLKNIAPTDGPRLVAMIGYENRCCCSPEATDRYQNYTILAQDGSWQLAVR